MKDLTGRTFGVYVVPAHDRKTTYVGIREGWHNLKQISKEFVSRMEADFYAYDAMISLKEMGASVVYKVVGK